MAILPIGRNRQSMNYATGTPNDTGGTSGGGQGQAPAQPTMPRMNMGFNQPPMWANRNMMFAPGPLSMRFQQGMGGMNPMANQLYGGMANVQVPAGQNIANFAGNNFQGGQPYSMRPMPLNPNMLVQQRRGVLPTQIAPVGSNTNPYRVRAY